MEKKVVELPPEWAALLSDLEVQRNEADDRSKDLDEEFVRLRVTRERADRLLEGTVMEQLDRVLDDDDDDAVDDD